MLSIRPAIATHSLTVLGRSIHPELYRTEKRHSIERNAYRATLEITTEGHVISFGDTASTLCEVVGCPDNLLPRQRQLTAMKIGRSSRFDTCCGPSIRYRTESTLEQVSDDFFWQIKEQFERIADVSPLLFFFDREDEMSIGAVSYIHLDQRARHLSVQSVHTFPQEYAILKTSSLFAIDG